MSGADCQSLLKIKTTPIPLCQINQKWPAPRSHMFNTGLYRENMKNSSGLKPKGLEP